MDNELKAKIAEKYGEYGVLITPSLYIEVSPEDFKKLSPILYRSISDGRDKFGVIDMHTPDAESFIENEDDEDIIIQPGSSKEPYSFRKFLKDVIEDHGYIDIYIEYVHI